MGVSPRLKKTMKLKVDFSQRPLVVGMRISEQNADVAICTLENESEFGAHVSLFDEDGSPLFVGEDNRLLQGYELFTARNTGLLWVREKGVQRGFTW